MTFQIKALPAEEFRWLESLSDSELVERCIEVHTASSLPGYPCRVSLQDLPIGTRTYLLNHCHLDGDTPYRATHAIFIGHGAETAIPSPDEIPDVLLGRLIAVRAIDKSGRIIAADAAEGEKIRPIIIDLLSRTDTDHIHLHYAKRGCFAARVERA